MPVDAVVADRKEVGTDVRREREKPKRRPIRARIVRRTTGRVYPGAESRGAETVVVAW